MTDDLWKRDEVDSPCVQLCSIHPDAKICVGCYRTMDEITDWSEMDARARIALKAALPMRASQIKRRRGGRDGRAARLQK